MAFKLSPLMRKYNALRRAKTALCAGKKTQTEVKKVMKTYVDAAVKAGQTKAEATKKANAVLKSKCSVSAKPKAKRKPAAKRKAVAGPGAKPLRQNAG